ncbi:MAG: phenylalanine--tRNA ligase subunit beta [Clostridia bacterium]|nr:phenylalanine--tRNA ligase subunit beta [Clostridia bacterium]
MKVSLEHLKSYVEINVSAEELCDRMVMAGFEVEEAINTAETMKNVVVGKILKITPHENSDHLLICQIDVGADEPVQIVTGAGNVFEGAYVPAALNNSLLPNGMNIKSGKLRGVASNGMLCSGGELCITEEDYKGAGVNGILILNEEYAPGTDMREVLGLNDWIIDFKITANRPDCQSFLGIAREIGVVLGTEFKLPVPTFETVGDDINNYMQVEVKNFDICPRYIGRFVKNLKIGPSPEWMKRALKASGMRSINNIVDITNFVMLETGQPLHAFDYSDIKGSKIIVRNAAEGEKITTLDDKEHTLTSEMLVIADAESPSCLAGIMGGLNSEIKDTTKNLFLESAKFRRDNVRRTSRAVGVRTESSARFERGTDIMNTEYASNRALQLIYELEAGEIVDGVLDVNNGLPAERELIVSVEKINALLGLEIPAEKMVSILNSLHIPTTMIGDTLNCKIPSFRDDIEYMADIAEEVMRIYGYDHIVGTPINAAVLRGTLTKERAVDDSLKSLLTANGMYEIATYSFIGSHTTEMLDLPEGDSRLNYIKILNPLGDEYSVMRTQLVTSMLTVISTNMNRKNADARFFEISKRFVPKALPLVEQPNELKTLALGLYGENEDFYTLKGLVEQVLKTLNITPHFERADEPYLHPGRAAKAVVGGKTVAVFGEVHPTTADKFDLNARAYVAEIYLDMLSENENPLVIYSPLPKFPAVSRDLALLCNSETPVGDLLDIIKNAGGKLLENVSIFDIYEGAQIPEGKKSVAFNLTLRSPEATLTDEQIETVMNRVIKKLDAAGAELRR